VIGTFLVSNKYLIRMQRTVRQKMPARFLFFSIYHPNTLLRDLKIEPSDMVCP